MKTHQNGQSLIEILIAVTVAGLLVGGAAALIAVILQSGVQNRYQQAASLLGQELMDRVTVFAEAKWYCSATGATCGIYNLGEGIDNKYWLDKDATGKFFSVPGIEGPIPLNTDTYQRYFYIENVNRDTSGNIVSGGEEDPSTQKITVKVEWSPTGTTQSVSMVKYLTRSRNQVFRQTDWSGNVPADCLPALNNPDNTFCFSTRIDFTGTPGEVKLLP